MGMGLRLLSGFVSARTSERYRRDLRTSPRRFRARMGSVLTEPDGGRFSGVARRTGMDCREISPLRSGRGHAAGLEAVARCGGLMKLPPQGWTRPFDDPISLPRGRQLVTLKDAAAYIQKLPEAEQQLAEWQAAVEALLLVVEHTGPTMMARIGVLRALNRHVERVFDPSRKERHWGRKK